VWPRPPLPGKTAHKPPGTALASVPWHKGDMLMLWFLALVMGGLGFGYVTVRRKRKAHKSA